jgi:hypothetical protein
MHEHIARALYYFEVHLLYASIVGFAAWALTSIRNGSATTKYWIRVATSLNFALPLGAALDKLLASHLAWAAPLSTMGDVANSISRGPAASVLWMVWSLGAILMLTRLCLRMRAEGQDAQAAAGQNALEPARSFVAHGVPVRFAGTRQAPAVHGILRPHISLSKGIDRWLNEHSEGNPEVRVTGLIPSDSFLFATIREFALSFCCRAAGPSSEARRAK